MGFIERDLASDRRRLGATNTGPSLFVVRPPSRSPVAGLRSKFRRFQETINNRGDFAHHLREGLKRAGVTRAELFVPQPNRLLLRAHDLRGSFVTLALAVGRTEAWVTDRTGHRSSAMIYNYKRAARTATELELGWYAALHRAISEIARSS